MSELLGTELLGSEPLPGTERSNEASARLGSLSAAEIVRLMHAQDALVPAAIEPELDAIATAVEAIAERLKAGGRLVLLGAGTSGRLALMEAAEAQPTFGVGPDRVIGIIAGGGDAERVAHEAVEDDRHAGMADVDRLAVSDQDAVVTISASGRTPYVLGAAERAGARGALTIGLACDDPTPLAEATDLVIHPLVGPEVVAGSTRLKAGTAQKLVLNMLTTGAMARLGKVHGNLMVDMRATNRKLRQRAVRIVEQVSGRGRDAATDALQAAGWSASVAIVMLARDLSADRARALLEDAGSLDAAMRGDHGDA